jgi:hypothetical protein
MNFVHENIMYENLKDIDISLLKTIDQTLLSPSEYQVYKTEEQIKSENVYANKLSTRNSAGAYIIPIENESVLINFIPTKRTMFDYSLEFLNSVNFEFFTEAPFSDEIPEPTSFEEGTIFRVVGEGFLNKEDYTYYVIDMGMVKKIPNYKTVEVMLFERNKSLEDIRIIELTEFDDLLHNSMINKLVQDGFTLEAATEEVAKFIITNQSDVI